MIEVIPNWHPFFVHFPIALLLVATVSLLIAAALPQGGQRRANLELFGHWNLRLGFVFALLAAWFGWLAYQSVPHDARAHEAMTQHRDIALFTLLLFLPFFALSWLRHRLTRQMALVFALALTMPAASLLATGWLGAELVFRHGVGVQRLPDPDDHHHHHGEEHHHHGDTRPHHDHQHHAEPDDQHGHGHDDKRREHEEPAHEHHHHEH